MELKNTKFSSIKKSAPTLDKEFRFQPKHEREDPLMGPIYFSYYR
jgi:hypothetical protein